MFSNVYSFIGNMLLSLTLLHIFTPESWPGLLATEQLHWAGVYGLAEGHLSGGKCCFFTFLVEIYSANAGIAATLRAQPLFSNHLAKLYVRAFFSYNN